MTHSPLHLDHQVCFGLYSLSRQVIQRYQPLLKPLGLTYPQYLVMLVMWQAHEEGEANVAVKHICERLLLDTGTVTPLLKRMEGQGVLLRQRSRQDERVVELALTADGLSLREQASKIPAQLLCHSGLTIEQAQAMNQTLRGWLTQLMSADMADADSTPL
ncbi:MAG: MarR family transcriptional regulator [Bacterioplanes sp.]|nr:MarR family transcriptional regulator [Bacterioplanes sp.]